MEDFKRRIINEAIKHGAKSSPFHDIGIKKDNINSWDWDEVRDGWEGRDESITEAQAVSGKYRFNSFKEGSISGWKVSIQSKGEVGFIEEPAKKNTRTSISPHKLFLYGKKEGEPDFVLSLWPSKETRMVGEREMRYAPRQLFNAVAMWMDKYGSKMVKEEDDTSSQTQTEANSDSEKYLARQRTLAENKIKWLERHIEIAKGRVEIERDALKELQGDFGKDNPQWLGREVEIAKGRIKIETDALRQLQRDLVKAKKLYDKGEYAKV
jgi:hypothetical protein